MEIYNSSRKQQNIDYRYLKLRFSQKTTSIWSNLPLSFDVLSKGTFFSEGAGEMSKHQILIPNIFLKLKSATFRHLSQINLFTVVTDRY